MEEPRRRGFYGLVAASVFFPAFTSAPTLFTVTGTPGGGSGGLRFGYRLATPFALELMYQYGDITVSGSTPDSNGISNKFSLTSNRIGANARIMSSGRRARFAPVMHEIQSLRASDFDGRLRRGICAAQRELQRRQALARGGGFFVHRKTIEDVKIIARR